MHNSLEERAHLRLAPPPLRGAEVTLSGLGKAYAGHTVLADLDLRIRPGEFVAVVGRSGCGKSTLLRLIAGLERADAGELRIRRGGAEAGDKQAKGEPEVRIMFQDARLLPWKRVLANVALGLSPSSELAAREVLAQVGLAPRHHDWPAVLSGGQRQRVALARALVHEPDLLLLDEPLGALDALTRIEMHQLIEKLFLERAFTAVLVTHDVSEAIALADRVLLIEDGQVVLDLRVDLPRPRARGSARFAELEAEVLSRVLKHPHDPALAEVELPKAVGWRWAV